MNVKTVATGNLATTAKTCLRTMRICINGYMQRRLSSLCPCSEHVLKRCAVPELIHPAEKASYGFVSWTWDHANMLSEYPGRYIAVQTVLGLCARPCRWWWPWGDSFCTWGIPPLVLRWVLVSCFGFPDFQNLALIFPPFFSTFWVFVSKTTCNFFRFITAVTVCSIIIISICFGPRHERICYWQFIVPTGQQYANN